MTPMPNRRSLLAGLALAVACSCALPAAADGVQPLALVGEDTLTTTDVKIELGLMKQRRESDGPTLRPEAEQVLRRLVQNRLVIQEGYRMGLHDDFAIANQVKEFVTTRAMGDHLDAVAARVPADAPDLAETRRLEVYAYMDSLYTAYHVQVDSTLLASLDYGRDDDAYQQHLREDVSVLAVVPRGTLTVAGFSRVLRFKEYHGLVGKVDADRRRDEALRNWVAEATLAHHLDELGTLGRQPYTTMAERLERDLVLQEALRVLLEFDFAPTEDEVGAYYEEHIADFTEELQVRLESLKVASAEQAEALRARVLDGTPMDWLRKNDTTVIKGPSPFPNELFPPAKLNLDPATVQEGDVPEPYQVPSGWVVAKVVEVRQPEARPLEACRNEVLKGLKSEQIRNLMIDILAQLEAATPVEILPGAEETVAGLIEEFIARQQAESEATANPDASDASPGQEG